MPRFPATPPSPAMKIATPKPGVATADGIFNREQCRDLIAAAEAHGFEEATVRADAAPAGAAMMKNIRNNDRLILDDPAFVEALWPAIQPIAPHVGLAGEPVGLNARLRIYRYDPTQRFKRHRDGEERVGDRVSRITVLIYLNDDFTGGATTFNERTYADGKGTDHNVTVAPTTGSALLFHHPLWHEGEVVTAGRKYVLRTDVLYPPTA